MPSTQHIGTGLTRIRNTLLLIIAAAIWGSTFVAQSIGAEHVDCFTFLASRSWIACALLIPWALVRAGRAPGPACTERPAGGGTCAGIRRALAALFTGPMLKGGLICGFFLFMGSVTQQLGVAHTTTAKAGFITTLYILFIPLAGLFSGRRVRPVLFLCTALALAGMYLLCIRGGLSLDRGDTLVLCCAFLFTGHILAVDRFAPHLDGVCLSSVQFLMTAVLATCGMLAFESPAADALIAAAPSILYAGVFSSGIAFTLQIIGQRDLDPAVAGIAMSLESVFSAVSGWLVLGQTLTPREVCGCLLIFAAVTLTQLPERKGLR